MTPFAGTAHGERRVSILGQGSTSYVRVRAFLGAAIG